MSEHPMSEHCEECIALADEMECEHKVFVAIVEKVEGHWAEAHGLVRDSGDTAVAQ